MARVSWVMCAAGQQRDIRFIAMTVTVVPCINPKPHATGIMVEPLFNAFATASFFEFVIFAIFEMRWLLMAWRARRGAQVTEFS